MPVTTAPAPIATFDYRDFSAQELAASRGGLRVTVCIPARDEEGTVGRVVGAVQDGLVDRVGLVDEVVVVDDGSRDATAVAAANAGARVVPSSTERAEDGGPLGLGKGGAIATGLAATESDLVVFLDADVTNLRAHFVTGLLGPLVTAPERVLVKGFYARAYRGEAVGGGRVTELVARPALSLLFPDLAGVEQPLAGETAVRRSALQGLEIVGGYGVEIGMLIDLAERFGPQALAQVDLGVRVHRSRPLDQLVPQAHSVLGAVLDRAGIAAR